jgi:hypothetical protein
VSDFVTLQTELSATGETANIDNDITHKTYFAGCHGTLREQLWNRNTEMNTTEFAC